MSNGFNPNQRRKILNAANRANSLPRGKWRDANTYRPGLTTIVMGKLTADLIYAEAEDADTWKASFDQWHWPTPTDDESEATASDYGSLDVWAWTMEDRTKLVSGTKITAVWISGRWVLADYQGCPIYLDDHDNDGIPNDEDEDYTPP